MNTNEIDNIASINKQISKSISSEKDLTIMINEIVGLIFKKRNEDIVTRQHVLDYLNNHNINSKEIYNWLLNNQNNSDSIFLLGYFNRVGIETTKDKKKAFSLSMNVSKQDHTLAQCYVGQCYQYGTGIAKNEKLAFEYYEKLANKDYAVGQFKLGYLYGNGIGIKKDLKTAVYWYEKAANNGHLIAMYNLANMYCDGVGIEKDIDNAIYWYEQPAKQGDQDAQNKLEKLKESRNNSCIIGY